MRRLTGQVVDQVFDEVADDGVERGHDDDGGQDDVEDVDGQMDGVSSRWDVILEENLLLSRRGQQRRLIWAGHHALIQNLQILPLIQLAQHCF